MNHCRLTIKIFECDFKNISKHNWSGKVLKIADELGFGDNMVCGEIFDLYEAKEKFKDIMHSDWSNNIGNIPKLRYYLQLKSDVNTEEYLTVNLTRGQ